MCPICNNEHEKSTGHYNRAIRLGLKLYCSRKCVAVGRRNKKPLEHRKSEKAEYDKKYRYYHKEGIKKRKAEKFKKDYAANPEKYREERKRRMQEHIEYCRTTHYKAKKVEYDKLHRARKNYGDFAECFLLTEKIISLIPDREQLKLDLGLTNKNQKRKRQWKILMQNL